MLEWLTRILRAAVGTTPSARLKRAAADAARRLQPLPSAREDAAANAAPPKVHLLERLGATPELLDITRINTPGRDLPVQLKLKIRKSLRITNHPRLRSLGGVVAVPGDLTLGGYGRDSSLTHEQRRIPLRELPRGLSIDGTLTLRSCFRLQRLPDDLSIGGSLVIEDCDALELFPIRWLSAAR